MLVLSLRVIPSVLFCFQCIICLSNSIPYGFVYVHDIVADIQVSLRYATKENFIGEVLTGYVSNSSILTTETAIALKTAQTLAKQRGFELVLYDGYRPQKCVDQFMKWSRNQNASQMKKSYYYPRINKEDAFELGYIAENSGHTRGSTVDLTLIVLGRTIKSPLIPMQRNLTDQSTILYLDDGTVDMGSSFDLFDEASHTNSTLVSNVSREKRLILKHLMQQAGFVNYAKEWWHYTLENEPFPNTYFDFDIA